MKTPSENIERLDSNTNSEFFDIQEIIENRIDTIYKQERVVREMLNERGITKEDQKHYTPMILEALIRIQFEEQSDTETGDPYLLEESFELPYHIHFWIQAIQRIGTERAVLEYDPVLNLDTETTMHSQKKESNAFILKRIEYLIENWNEIREQIQPEIEKFQEMAKDNPIVFVGNHDDWATIFIIPALIDSFQAENKTEQNVLIGPATSTFASKMSGALSGQVNARKLIQSFANVYMTLPDTKRARPREIDETHMQKYSFKCVKNILGSVKKNSMTHIAISGTTDKKESGKIYPVPPSESSIKFIQNLNTKKDAILIPVGFSMNNVFENGKATGAPKKISIKFGTPYRPNEMMCEKSEITNEGHHLMEKITNLIRNPETGESQGVYVLD